MTACALFCHGKVFLRWGRAARDAEGIQSIGGRLAYQASVTVNEGHGDLAVLAFDAPPEIVVARLRSLFADAEFDDPADGMALGSGACGNLLLRFLILSLDSTAETLVFKLAQDRLNRTRALLPPPAPSIHGVCVYPEATPLFLFTDRTARAGLLVSETAAPAPAVKRFIAQHMASSGWTASLPAHSPDASLTLYLRAGALCSVMVNEPAPSGMTRITVLHKRQELK